MIQRAIDAVGAEPVGWAIGPERALAHALADELVALTSALADLAYDLAGNPDTLRHHMHSLQSVDRITQTQLAIADLLRSPAPVGDALQAVTLEELGSSVRAAVERYRQDGITDG